MIQRFNIKIGRNLLSLFFIIFFSSCSSFLENDNEFFHVATQEQQWNSLTDTRSALFGVYGLMRSALSENNTYWAVGELRMGDFSVRTRDDLQAIRSNNLNLPYDIIQNISDWTRFYKVINAACVFIENAGQVVKKDVAYSELNYKYDVAQARVLRALAYFYMVRMWGDVPLIKESYDNGSFPNVERTDKEVVLNYVEEELLAASKVLPERLGSSSDKYYGNDANYWNGILVNRYSTYAILAHLAAWRSHYTDVEQYSSYLLEKINTLITDYITVENLTSSQGFFMIDCNNSYRSGRLLALCYRYKTNEVNEVGTDGHLESWTLAEPIVRKQLPDIYLSKDTLKNMFMKNTQTDSRYGMDLTTTPISYTTNYLTGRNLEYPIFSKIKVLTGSTNGTHDMGVYASCIVMSRIEDILLLRAEALVQLNRPVEALDLLNNLRSVRNLSLLSYSKDLGKNEKLLLEEIFDERRRELVGEGHRWFDRIRAARLLGEDKEMLELLGKEGAIYWPVSDRVLLNNPAIKQNEYWQ